jgi:hypothetical protein
MFGRVNALCLPPCLFYVNVQSSAAYRKAAYSPGRGDCVGVDTDSPWGTTAVA